MTDSQPDSNPAAKPRGLWSLMGTTEPATPSAEPEKPLVESDESANREPPPGEVPSESPIAPKQRGLWGMMGQPAAVSPIATVMAPAKTDEAAASYGEQVEQEKPIEHDRAGAPPFAQGDHTPGRAEPRRGLFALMQVANEHAVKDLDAVPLSVADRDEVDRSGDVELEDDSLDLVSPNENHSDRLGLPPVAIDLEELEPPKYRVAATSARRQARGSLVCGLIAILASALSLLPNILSGIPATAAGFVAIILGYMAITGPGRREISGATQAVSIFGMALGTAGIFLGPLLFASIGRTFREATGQRGTIQHLTQVGDALDRHYQEHDGYPIGGTFARNDAGVIQGQHGWMTFLLPYVGEAALYQEVDQSKPFDDPINRKPMGRNVTVYFAAGGDRSRIGQGFAVAHFAGVGGEIDDGNRLSHLGIFERDVAIKREEIADGLSNTLIVGELAGAYPPWGDPENWRKIGRGLNRDVNGFGSYNGIGSTFLLADGSVKFFNNKTDPKLLETMTTRDGGE